MAALAERNGWKAFSAEPGALIAAVFPAFAGAAARVSYDGDARTARALAGAGMIGLFGMPLLMVASVISHAPFAAPAAISLGYLAAAQALALGRPERAGLWCLAVLALLIAWTLLSFVVTGGAISPVWLASALLAPLFAAAPALVHRLGGSRDDPQRRAAHDDTACLQRHAPSEAVLMLDRGGRLLAGTDAGLRTFGLTRRDLGQDLTRSLHMLDGPALLGALARSSADAGSANLLLRIADRPGGGACVSASLVAGREGTVALRLDAPRAVDAGDQSRIRGGTEAVAGGTLAPEAAPDTSSFDLDEAVSFAARHSGPRAAALGMTLHCEGEAGALAACDRQLGRRLVQAALADIVAASAPGADIAIATRRLKGAVLLRISSDEAHRPIANGAADAVSAAGSAALTDMVEQAGGTMVAERRGPGLAISIRLAPATPARDNHDAIGWRGAD